MSYREMGGSSNKIPSRDRPQLSFRPTPNNSRSSGEMRPGDRARTSDGSQSRHEKLMLSMMAELKGLRNDLKEANQKVLELTQEKDNLKKLSVDLANQLEQANRKNRRVG